MTELSKNRLETLNEDMIGLVELFKDLEELTFQAQPKLDLIESNITHTKRNIEIVEKDIIQAKVYQDNSQWLKIGIATIMMTGISLPLCTLVGLKIGLGVTSGIVLTYIMT